MSQQYQVNRSNTPLLQRDHVPEPPIFPNWLKVSLAVVAVASITFAVLAGMNYLAPYSAIAAGSLGIGEILFIAIWYCCKKSQEKIPEQPLFNPPSFESPRKSFHPPRGSSIPPSSDKGHVGLSRRDPVSVSPPRESSVPQSSDKGRVVLSRRDPVSVSPPRKSSILQSSDKGSVGSGTKPSSSDRQSCSSETKPLNLEPLPRSPEEWDFRLSHLKPDRANLTEGTDTIGNNTKAGFHPVPYVGNYDTSYASLSAPYIQWKLPPSQLAGFPEEMQRIFGWYANRDLLDLYFIGANDPGGRYLARNLVMHALALPEYDPMYPQPSFLPKDVYSNAGGIGTYVQMRIFEPQGIDPYPLKKDAIPFDSNGVAQFVNYHPGRYNGVAISPNNARFMIKEEAEYCSFYVGAVYRGRACAFFVVLTRTEANHLVTALESSSNLMEFSVHLEGAPYKENIDKLLRSY